MMRLSFAAVALLAAVAAAQNCQIVNDYGCYVDTVQPRTLPNQADNANSWIECAQNCYNDGFTGTAGTENGQECWCSNDTGSVGDTAPSTDCSAQCPDDPSKTCGGESRLNEFSFTCSGGGQTYYSCNGATCQEDPNGPWTTPDCDNACVAPPGPSPPSPPSPPGPLPPGPPGPAPPGPPGHKKSKSGLSGGEIILIVFFCGLVLPYIVFGMLFMHFRRGATGTEMLPNRDFWASLPGLIKDGFSFTFSKMSGRSGSYEQI